MNTTLISSFIDNGRKTIWPLRVLAIVAVVMLGGITADQLIMDRSKQIEDTLRKMSNIDMLLAEQAGRAIETIDVILRTIEAEPLSSIDMKRIWDVPQLLQVARSDKTGKLTWASGPILDVPPVVKAFIASGGAGLRISPPFRVMDGRWTAVMVRGLTVGFLRLSYFTDFYKAVDLGDDAAILLHLRDGTVLVRVPPNDSAIGESYGNLPPFRDVLAHAQAGTLIMASPLDGNVRIMAIRALRRFPLAVNVSVNEGDVLSSWRRQLWTFSLVVTGACIMMLSLLFILEIMIIHGGNEGHD